MAHVVVTVGENSVKVAGKSFLIRLLRFCAKIFKFEADRTMTLCLGPSLFLALSHPHSFLLSLSHLSVLSSIRYTLLFLFSSVFLFSLRHWLRWMEFKRRRSKTRGNWEDNNGRESDVWISESVCNIGKLFVRYQKLSIIYSFCIDMFGNAGALLAASDGFQHPWNLETSIPV